MREDDRCTPGERLHETQAQERRPRPASAGFVETRSSTLNWAYMVIAIGSPRSLKRVVRPHADHRRAGSARARGRTRTRACAWSSGPSCSRERGGRILGCADHVEAGRTSGTSTSGCSPTTPGWWVPFSAFWSLLQRWPARALRRERRAGPQLTLAPREARHGLGHPTADETCASLGVPPPAVAHTRSHLITDAGHRLIARTTAPVRQGPSGCRRHVGWPVDKRAEHRDRRALLGCAHGARRRQLEGGPCAKGRPRGILSPTGRPPPETASPASDDPPDSSSALRACGRMGVPVRRLMGPALCRDMGPGRRAERLHRECRVACSMSIPVANMLGSTLFREGMASVADRARARGCARGLHGG